LYRKNDVIGIPVLCIELGEIIGRVSDIVFCAQQEAVVAFCIDCRKRHPHSYIILLRDIFSLSKDVLMINNTSCLYTIGNARKKGLIQKILALQNIVAYCSLGYELGIVKEILFDHKTGKLEALELSDSFFQDIVNGRYILPLIGKVSFGENTVIVGKDTFEEMTSTGKGLKNILSQLTNRKR